MEEKKEQNKTTTKQRKGKKSLSKLIFVVLIFALVIIGIIFLGKYLNKMMDGKNLLKGVHEDVSLNTKEKSYYDLLVLAMNEHEELVTGAEHVYFNLYDLPKLEHEEKENVAKKVLHSFAIHKDKELLIDTFDGLYFRGILDIETSELKDGIYVTFADLEMDSKETKKQFAISIYKTSDLNPTITYDVTLDEEGKILKYTKISDLLPHENVEGYEAEESQESVEE